jgi:enoyl-CoA hydratase
VSSDFVTVELDRGVATIAISDPNGREFVADSHPMHRELRDVFPALSQDDEVAVVIVAGGRDAFCPFPTLANLDALLSANPDAAFRLQTEARQIVENLIAFDKPLIAAPSVPAAGFGAQLAFLCDFIVASRNVFFQDTHVRLGLTAGDGATVVWPLLLGFSRARRHVLRGHPLSAEDADASGLLAELVDEPNEVLPAARLLADKLALLPAMAYSTTKQALNSWLLLGASASLGLASAHQIATYESPEFREIRRTERGSASDDV